MAIDIEEAGSPRRKTQAEDKEAIADADSSGGRTKRVSVTPNDPEKLAEVAERLGLPKSKVYNMGFQHLVEKLNIE